MGREQSIKLGITVSGGTGTGTTTKIWDVARWIRVIPVAETDTYDVTFKDGDGHIMASRTNQTGTLSEHLDFSLGILSSVLIENATQEGTYWLKADMH